MGNYPRKLGGLRAALFIQAYRLKRVDSLFATDSSTMEFHCNSIVRNMAGTKSFSITLPKEAIEMIEEGLIPFGLYGKHLATISATLILDALKRASVQENIKEGRAKAAAATAGRTDS
jgi:hypothetical protein